MEEHRENSPFGRINSEYIILQIMYNKKMLTPFAFTWSIYIYKIYTTRKSVIRSDLPGDLGLMSRESDRVGLT